jgi:5-methylcytosine-specific restriction endonuclease McrA
MPNHPFYKTAFWLSLRRAALQRAKYTCEAPGCGRNAQHFRLYVDHIAARPYSDGPTSADTLANVRVLCEQCDAKVRQLPDGTRRNGGRVVVPGCDVNGLPTDPAHPWNRSA